MTAIEVMALILALFSAVKLVAILLKPKFWMDNVAKKLWARPGIVSLVSLVIAAISLMFLLKELTVVQIFAVMFFFTGLMAMGFAPYSKDMLALIEERMAKDRDILKKNWLAIIVWSVLIIWVLCALFACFFRKNIGCRI